MYHRVTPLRGDCLYTLAATRRHVIGARSLHDQQQSADLPQPTVEEEATETIDAAETIKNIYFDLQQNFVQKHVMAILKRVNYQTTFSSQLEMASLTDMIRKLDDLFSTANDKQKENFAKCDVTQSALSTIVSSVCDHIKTFPLSALIQLLGPLDNFQEISTTLVDAVRPELQCRISTATLMDAYDLLNVLSGNPEDALYQGKCQRKEPPCKYLHPPQHLREQLLQNGRNNLILKNLQLQAAQAAVLSQQGLAVPGLIPVSRPEIPTSIRQSNTLAYSAISPVPSLATSRPEAHPYMSGTPTQLSAVPNPYSINMQTMGVVPSPQTNGETPSVLSHPAGCIPTAMQSSAKLSRPDRLEVCREFQRGTCTRQPSECRYAHPPDNVTVDTTDNHVTVCMDYVKGKCTRDSCRYFHPPPHLQAQIRASQQRANAAAAAQAQALPQVLEVLTGKKRARDPSDDLILQQTQIAPMMGQYKRVAMADSKGFPMYQPANANMLSYHQQAIAAMQLQQPQYIPVTLPMMVSPVSDATTTLVAPPPPPLPGSFVPSNAYSINYFDDNKQLQDTLRICRDFNLGLCNRPHCKYTHVVEDYVEVVDGRVTVCRDAVRGKCSRPTCKYYHIPVPLPNSE